MVRTAETNKAERRRRANGGFSLTEVIITVALMSTVILALVAAAGVTVKISAASRGATKIESLLDNAADRVNRAPAQCDYKIYVEAAALSLGWPASSVSIQYQWFQPNDAGPSSAGAWNTGSCPGGVRTDELVQLVSITAASPDGRIQRTIQVVKSDV